MQDSKPVGRLIGLGIGPGDPELLTLKALRYLHACPVIAYPQLGDTPSFARAIVSPHIEAGKGNKAQIEISFSVPLGGHEATANAYDKAAEKIAEALEAKGDVAVLCEGDAFFYGSFMYLWSRLADRFDCEIVPGVSSLMAAPARMQRPLAAGNDIVTILPAILDDDVLAARLKATDSAVIMKLGRHLPRIRQLIKSLGLEARAHYIERATLPNEEVRALSEIGDAAAPYFSMILIGRNEEAPR